jgi:two-component system, cell cycle response regulator DivK
MNKRILVIEDQEDNRRILRDLLTSVGYELIEAVTGEEGVTLAERHRPDLILMDILLPGLNGYDATRLIKAQPALRQIPIIAVTSYALSGDDTKALEAGCEAYVTKRSARANSWRRSASFCRTTLNLVKGADYEDAAANPHRR